MSHGKAISNPAFWFLLVSEPQKPIKTNKNQETGKLGNPGPISQKPPMSTRLVKCLLWFQVTLSLFIDIPSKLK